MRLHPWNSTSAGSNGSGWGTPVKRFLGDKILGHPTCRCVCSLGLSWELPWEWVCKKGEGGHSKGVTFTNKLKLLNLTKIKI